LLQDDDEPGCHIANDPRGFIMRQQHSGFVPPWVFIFHMVSPGPPWFSMALYFVPSYGRSLQELFDSCTTGTNLLKKCMANGADEWRRLKLIPQLIEAPLALRAAVGSNPILCGSHCERTVHSTKTYYEAVLNMGNSSLNKIFYNLFASQTEQCVLDCAILLEGECDEELPEELLAVAHVAGMHTGLAYTDALSGEPRDDEEEPSSTPWLPASMEYYASIQSDAWFASAPEVDEEEGSYLADLRSNLPDISGAYHETITTVQHFAPVGAFTGYEPADVRSCSGWFPSSGESHSPRSHTVLPSRSRDASPVQPVLDPYQAFDTNTHTFTDPEYRELTSSVNHASRSPSSVQGRQSKRRC